MCPVPAVATLKFSPGCFLVLHSSEDRRGANTPITMKSFATVAVLLLGLTSSASALFFKNESMINQNGADLGCFNTFETTNSNAFDVCTWGLLGGAFFIFFFASYAGMSPDISARHGYDNAYNYEQQRGDLGKHPFANSGNIVSKAVSK